MHMLATRLKVSKFKIYLKMLKQLHPPTYLPFPLFYAFGSFPPIFPLSLTNPSFPSFPLFPSGKIVLLSISAFAAHFFSTSSPTFSSAP
jgi:hypothetical protein